MKRMEWFALGVLLIGGLAVGKTHAPSSHKKHVHVHKKNCPAVKYQAPKNSFTTADIYGEKGSFKGEARIASASRPLSSW